MELLAASNDRTLTVITICVMIGILAIVGCVMIWVELFSKLNKILELLHLQDQRWQKRYGGKTKDGTQ